MKQKIENLYVNHYKKLIIVPLLLLIFSFAVLGINYARNGEIIGRDVELKGGVEVTIDKPGVEVADVEGSLSNNGYEDFTVRELTDFATHKNLGVTIKIGELAEDDVNGLKESLRKSIGFSDEQFSSSVIQAEFSAGFYRSLMLVILFSFITMPAPEIFMPVKLITANGTAMSISAAEITAMLGINVLKAIDTLIAIIIKENKITSIKDL